MALANPNVQQRNQYGKDWGTYASVLLCPNASSWGGGANAAAALEAGDLAFVTGLGPVYCVSAGTVGGLNAVWSAIGVLEASGFQSSNLANYYRIPAASAGTCPGANNFIVMALVVPFANRTAFADMIVQMGGPLGNGWRLNWDGGNLLAAVGVTGPGTVTPITGGDYESADEKGKLHVVTLRCYQSGGSTVVELWLGPAMYATASGAANVIPAGAVQMSVAFGSVFGNERALNGGVYGLGYYVGTVTDDQLRQLAGRACAQQALPRNFAWTNAWAGIDVVGAPASWPAIAGGVALERVGAPTGSQAYFPTV